MKAYPKNVEAHPGAMEGHPFDMNDLPGAMKTHPGDVDAQLGAIQAHTLDTEDHPGVGTVILPKFLENAFYHTFMDLLKISKNI
jgi:hypothetical protein